MGETTDRIVTDAELDAIQRRFSQLAEHGGSEFAAYGVECFAVCAALREARLMIVELLRCSHWGTVQRVKSNASDKHDSRITRMGESLPSVARRILHALGETTE